MRYRGIDLNLLAALEVLLSERNVTRAATRLNLSQSAASSALARLREQLDDELLVQAGRELRRSGLAEELLPKVRTILAQVDSNLIDVRVADPRKAERRVRIMASDYVALAMLGRCVAEVSKEAPGLSFDIVPVLDSPWRAIENYSVDLLITLDVYNSKQHPSVLFFEDDYVVLACGRTALQIDRLSVDQYLSLPQVSVRFQREGLLTHDERHLEQAGLRKHSVVTVHSHALVPYFIIGTQRIATLQRRQAVIFARQFPLKIIDIPVEIPPVRETIQWHVSSNGDSVLDYLRSRFAEIARAEPL